MKRLATVIIVALSCAVLTGTAYAQRDWMTENGDAQRSAWVRSDGKISKATMEKPGFDFLWKIKFKNESKELNSVTPAATLERLIGYRGFRMLGFFGGSSDSIFTVDTDLGRMEWEKKFTSNPPAFKSTVACPGGMTTSVVRPTITAIPSTTAGGGGGGFGRSGPAKSGVGEAGQGAVTLANVRPNPPGPPPGPAPGANPPAGAAPRPNAAAPPGGQFGRGPFLVYALTGDGMLHGVHLSNGADYESAIPFLPPNASPKGLIVTDRFAYVITDQNCAGVPNGLWALDLDSKKVSSWKANVTGLVGAAFDGDGNIYVTTGSGGEKPNSIVALDPKTLTVKGAYSAGAQAFSTSPVLFTFKGKTLIAATTKDGNLHLVDSGNLSAALNTAAAKASDSSSSALASWQDAGGTRWVLVPTANAVAAWKIVENGGSFALESGWTSPVLVSPLPPTVINGIAFVTSSGEFRGNPKMNAAQIAKRSSNAVLYALDATTGKELWNSGKTIVGFVHGAAISGGMGQVYLATNDGTVYAFGIPMEH